MTDRRELRLRERIDSLIDERDEARAVVAELDAMRDQVRVLSARCAKLERQLEKVRADRDRANKRRAEITKGRDYWRKRGMDNAYLASMYRKQLYYRKRKGAACSA